VRSVWRAPGKRGACFVKDYIHGRDGFGFIKAFHLSWTLANFRCSETAGLQVFPMPARIFARSRASPGPTKKSVYPYILGRFAHPPLQKLAKVKLRHII
jgi:hypothetical protein